MAEYLIQSETLTSMADKIRILNSVEGNMTPTQMDSNLGEANTEVSSQADLIAQITSALEGKAGSGGSGEDAFAQFIEGYLTDLNSNASYVTDNRFTMDIVLETVNFPYAVGIAAYAFYGCENLKTAKIPSATSIGSDAF